MRLQPKPRFGVPFHLGGRTRELLRADPQRQAKAAPRPVAGAQFRLPAAKGVAHREALRGRHQIAEHRREVPRRALIVTDAAFVSQGDGQAARQAAHHAQRMVAGFAPAVQARARERRCRKALARRVRQKRRVLPRFAGACPGVQHGVLAEAQAGHQPHGLRVVARRGGALQHGRAGRVRVVPNECQGVVVETRASIVHGDEAGAAAVAPAAAPAAGALIDGRRQRGGLVERVAERLRHAALALAEIPRAERRPGRWLEPERQLRTPPFGGQRHRPRRLDERGHGGGA